MFQLPDELQRHIYSYDSTYKDFYNTVMLQLQDEYIYKADSSRILIIANYSDDESDYETDYESDDESDYTYDDYEEESNCVWGCIGCGL